MSKSLNNKQLRCFLAVAEHLSFRVAAERLHMTQPPLSRQIKKLEETLGVQLFERSRQGVRITEAGERLIHDARALLRKTDDTIKRYRSDSKESPQELNVGITTAIDVGILPKLISKFREKYPGIKLDVKPMMSFELIRDLKNRTLDVALIGLPSQTDNLVVEPIFSDPLTVALPSQHPLVRKKRFPLVIFKTNLYFGLTAI